MLLWTWPSQDGLANGGDPRCIGEARGIGCRGASGLAGRAGGRLCGDVDHWLAARVMVCGVCSVVVVVWTVETVTGSSLERCFGCHYTWDMGREVGHVPCVAHGWRCRWHLDRPHLEPADAEGSSMARVARIGGRSRSRRKAKRDKGRDMTTGSVLVQFVSITGR